MKLFFKENRLISFVFAFSVLSVVIYTLTLEESEWFPHAGDWFNILFQLSIGFIINFMFYVTQVYVPRIKQNKQAYSCIYIRVTTIESYMKEFFDELAKVYISDYKKDQELSEEQLVVILQNLDFDNEINVINVNSDCYFTVKKWMHSRMEFIEHDIDKLYLYYSSYISSELMNVLEKILKSPMHQTMGRTFMHLPRKISFKECNEDIFFKDYYALLKELKEIGAQYK